ncbi:MAG TPA: T9SS type A sorting domain-containing protein [Clostridiales bacterium]|nr:T9SS type A sorting domain-containing protein [Clostridiales bacterium]HQP69487.1 T9SS type A sorting domain-containing protein [Clostridiales bacterium]
MKMVILYLFLIVFALNAQVIVWEKKIDIGTTVNSVTSFDKCTDGSYIATIASNTSVLNSILTGVVRIDSCGSILYSHNYGHISNSSDSKVLQNNDNYILVGDSTDTGGWISTELFIYNYNSAGQRTGSIKFNYFPESFNYLNSKTPHSGGVTIQYSVCDISDFERKQHGRITRYGPSLNHLATYQSSESPPDSLSFWFDTLGQSNYPYEDSFSDFLSVNDGILVSGRWGDCYWGWDMLELPFIKFYSSEKGKVWEHYYLCAYETPDWIGTPIGYRQSFINLTVNADNDYALSKHWIDFDRDYRSVNDSTEMFITKIDLNTGDLVWSVNYPYNIDQLLNCGDDLFYIRNGTEVKKVSISGDSVETLWVTNFPNTGNISPCYGGYISSSILNDDLYVYRYYEYSGIEIGTVPSVTQLYQNYPNPFNPETEISFDMNRETNIRLSIYNTKGEFVESVAEGKFAAGPHKAVFKADGLNSGIYFYRLESDGVVVDSKRMLLLK